MEKLVLASRNKGKLEEFSELLVDLPLEIVGVDEFPDVPEVEETGITFKENAILKATIVGEAIGKMVLADDSGLVVDALNGEPGVYSARYGKPEWDGRGRYLYLLEKLAEVPETQRMARFVSVLVLYDPLTKRMETVEGTVEGSITTVPVGENGFGYDPVFFVPEFGCTMAQLPFEVKNRISHRGRAIAKLRPLLTKFLEEKCGSE